MNPEKVIIDCDAGIDDALALILLVAAHKRKRIEILAITCVHGNTTIDNVVKNVYRVLKICNAEDIPVYKGADSALLSLENTRIARECKYHGEDGLADVFTDEPDTRKLKKEHAVCVLPELTSKYYGQVTLLCIAPLTNIALAMKLNPGFLNSVNKIVAMGGNSSGVGNITSQAEFNFYADPESAHIVLSGASEKMWIVPWETATKSTITYNWRNNDFGKIDSPIVKFIDLIDGAFRCRTKDNPYETYVPCDVFAAGILLRPKSAQNVITRHVDVELSGLKTRGQVVIDHKMRNEPNAHVVQDVDSEIIKDLLVFAVKPTHKNSIVLYS